MKSQNIKADFAVLKKLLAKHAQGLEVRTTLVGSKAKEKKPMYGLVGKKEVAIGNREPQKTYVVGIIAQKHFVGFYSMPIYSHPKMFPKLGPKTRKFLKGKSCFNVTHLDKDILRDLEYVIVEGIKIYKKEHWI